MLVVVFIIIDVFCKASNLWQITYIHISRCLTFFFHVSLTFTFYITFLGCTKCLNTLYIFFALVVPLSFPDIYRSSSCSLTCVDLFIYAYVNSRFAVWETENGQWKWSLLPKALTLDKRNSDVSSQCTKLRNAAR